MAPISNYRLEDIYKDYKDKVYGYLYNRTNNPSVAEDLCSDVFLKITANIDKFDSEKSALSTWIYNITRNTLFDYFRTRHESGELCDETPEDEDFVDKICNDEMLETLADALGQMDEREREIIVRHYYNGETLGNVAEKMGISYSYVRILHKSGLNFLAEFFENSSHRRLSLV